MQVGRVIVTDRSRDPALRVAGVALRRRRLGEDENTAGLGQPDRRAQTSDAAADDQKIGRVHADAILPSRMDPVRIDVATPSRAYAVTIADGALDRIGPLLDDLRVPARRFVVSSPLVWRLHGPRLSRSIDATAPILVPDGERFKHLATVTRIYDALVQANADRASDGHHVWRRRHRRHGGVRGSHLSARHRGCARPDDAAGAGGQRHRRQGRRQPSAPVRT